jgi:acyl-lipid omega-6 desaturase (Delta-12 desaturase)
LLSATDDRPGDARPEDDEFEDGPTPRALDRYAHPHLGRSGLSFATSVVPFVGLWVLMYLALGISYWLVLVLAVPTAGFLLRTYILFHDCTHGSFLPWRRANAWLGSVLALITFTPFARWRYEHVGHHATAGNLDRRGIGDVPTLTLAEYESKGWGGRFWYRFFRNPWVMFTIGPTYSMVVMPRVSQKDSRPPIRRSVWRTNVAIVVAVGAMCWLVGWDAFLLIEAPLIALAGAAGLWLFYVQHQFDDVYWEHTGDWSYTEAAMRGSSYLRLPRVLQFFTGNIGYHHVHHLNPRIPNYNLQRAHEETAVFAGVREVSIWEGLKAVRLKVWDEHAARMATWGDVRRRRRRAPAPVTG